MTIGTEMAEHKILASSGQRPRSLQCVRQPSKQMPRVEQPYINGKRSKNKLNDLSSKFFKIINYLKIFTI